MNYLITGFPGTGKTAIAQELKKRGHVAYDPENIRGYMHTVGRVDGRHLQVPEVIPTGWYDDVAAYNWDPIKIAELLDSDRDVYICSKAHNQSDFYDKFDKIFVLTLDSDLLTMRLKNRPGHSIGKHDSELQDILKLHEHFESSLINKGAIQVDSSRPLDHIVDAILRTANE